MMFNSLVESITSIKNTYKAEIVTVKYDYSRNVNITKLFGIFRFDTVCYTESLYNTGRVNISERDYGSHITTVILERTVKIRNKILCLSLISRSNIDTTVPINLIPYVKRNCIDYVFRKGNVSLVIFNTQSKYVVAIDVLDSNFDKDLYYIMKTISVTLFNSDDIISPKIYNIVTDFRISYCGEISLPRHISASKLYRLNGNYLCAKKLDGERRFICITLYGVFAFDRSNRVYVCSYESKEIGIQSLLDCEYYDNKYYVIDAIVVKCVNVSKYSYSDRIGAAKYLLDNELEHDSYIMIREYYNCDNLMFGKIVSDVSIDNKYDGIILFNNDLRYGSVQYKIKKVNTCDLLYIGTDTVETSDKQLYNIVKYTGMEINCVYECMYNNVLGLWNPIKIRKDKSKAVRNRYIYYTLKSISVLDICIYNNRCIRMYSNYLKNTVISTHLVGSVLLDIGTGYGVDIFKWRNRYSYIYVVEKDAKKVPSIISNFSKIRYDKYTLIPMKVSDVDFRTTVKHKIDVITVFYSIMMFDDRDFESLFDVLVNVVDKDCLVDIIVADGSTLLSVGPDWVKKKDDDTVVVTVPDTSLDGNVEYLVSVDGLCKKLYGIGLELVTIYNLDGNFAMNVKARTFVNAFYYLRFKR